VTLPDAVLSRIDAYAAAIGYPRLEFLALAARKAMAA